MPTGTTPLAIALPHLDADPLADFAALNSDGSLTVALNAGDGHWTATTTTPLGITNPAAFAFGYLDQDLFTDLVVQTSDGLLVGRGDGTGRFANQTTLLVGAAGSLAAPVNGRVELAIAHLADGDPFADIVTVAPGTNQVVVLRGTGFGGFAPAVSFASEGDQPVAVIVAPLLGDAAPDLAVGHRDGSVTFFRGNADGTFTLRPELTVSGLGIITGMATADLDGNGEIDLVVSGTDRATTLMNPTDSTPEPVIVNGDFTRGLTGWSLTSGTVTAGGGYAEFREGAALLSTIRQSFVVPAGAERLTFDLTAYGLEAPTGGLPDVFEASLLGADHLPLLPAFRPGASSFFHVGPDHTVGLGSGASFDGTRVTLDLAGIPAGTTATLVFHLAGSPMGSNSVVGIDHVTLDPAVVYRETFTATPLEGPFASAGGVATGDVDGDGRVDIVIADGDRAVVFNGTSVGTFVRSEYPLASWGSGATSVAIAPLTAGDPVADVAVGLTSGGAVTPLAPPFGPGPNAAPRLATLAPLTGTEGSPVSLEASFHDADGGEPYTATVDWGDGSLPSTALVTFANGVGTIRASHTFADNGTYPVRVVLRSAVDGAIDFQDVPATIANAAPSVTTNAVSVVVGSLAELALGSFADAGFTRADFGTRETFLATIDWGDATPTPFARVALTNGQAGVATVGSLFGSHRFAAAGTYTGSITVTDDDGGITTQTFFVTVIGDTASGLVIPLAPSVAASEGEAFTFTVLFTDSTPSGPYTATIQWGDGVTSPGSVAFHSGIGSVLAPHTYADNGIYPITLTLTDPFGASVVRSFSAAITNIAPAIAPLADQSTQAGTALSVLAAFTDPGFTSAPAGTAETFTATIDWGDGTGVQSLTPSVGPGSFGIPTVGSVPGSHTYLAAGTYTVTLTVTDDDQGTTAVQFQVTVTSAPSGGLGCFPAATPVITGISRALATDPNGATTNDPTLIFSGTGEPGATLTVIRQGVGVVGTTVVGGKGTWRFDYTAVALGAGSYTFTVEQAAFGPLGVASGFNGFVFQNLSGIPDAEGRLAAGGDVTLANFSIGQLLPDSNGVRDDLIAGGDLILTGGQLPRGNAVYGDTRTVSSYTGFPQGALRKESVIDFAAAETYLLARADAWAALTTTGTTTYTLGGDRWAIALAGSEAGLNVFTVDGAKLSAASEFRITAPAGATVLVNVTGTSGQMENFTFFLNGVSKQQVLFNFAGYTSLRLSGIGVSGSVLAPRAEVNFVSGNLDGTLVARSLTGGGELHHFPFLATCPIATSSAFVVTVTNPTTPAAAKFFVVGAGAGDRYSETGVFQGSNLLANPTGVPVGVATNLAGTTLLVAIANPDGTTEVWEYDADGSVRGRWLAHGVTDARDVATNGTDVWVVGRDASTSVFKVFRFAKGISVRSGGLEAIASFTLGVGNTNPTGLATDGSNLFITDQDAQGGRVFAYDINGTLLGGSNHNPWRLDTRNADPSGVTLNPSGGSDLWVVDKTTKQVFRYSNGRNNQWFNTGGPQTATSVFNLVSPARKPALNSSSLLC